MRGIALTHGGVEVVDLPDPSAGPGELLVRTLAVGLCGTDATLASGRRPVPFLPWLLGHEAVGTVAAVGGGVQDWRVGDLAVLEPNLPCLACPTCGRGLTSACGHRASAGVKTQPGFLAEWIVHPAEFCFRADPGTPVEDLVCIEPLAVASAAVRRSGVRPGETALVLGAGAQGLFTSLVLRAHGVTPVITDVRAEAVELAVRHGARPLASADADFTHVFDACGVPAALAAVWERLAPGAAVTCVGESHDPLQLSSFQLVQRQVTLRGSFIYDHPVDFAATLDAVTTGRLRPSAVLAEPRSLDEAVTWLRSPAGAGKPWVDLR